MMKLGILRSFGAVVVGCVVALTLLVAAEVVSNMLHPFPEGADTSDMDVCRAHVANYPPWLLAAFTPWWGGTLFVSTWVATLLGTNRHPAHGILIAVLFVAAAIFNMSMLPYPIWFEALNVIAFPLAIYWGLKKARKKVDASKPSNGEQSL